MIVMMQIPAVDQAFLLFVLIFCLGTCLVRALWEMEQIRAHPNCVAAAPTHNQA